MPAVFSAIAWATAEALSEGERAKAGARAVHSKTSARTKVRPYQRPGFRLKGPAPVRRRPGEGWTVRAVQRTTRLASPKVPPRTGSRPSAFGRSRRSTIRPHGRLRHGSGAEECRLLPGVAPVSDWRYRGRTRFRARNVADCSARACRRPRIKTHTTQVQAPPGGVSSWTE